MKLHFWGVRGSLPTPGPSTLRFGGNTSCYEVCGQAGECVILDAGTGLRPLGLDLARRFKLLPPIHLLISHTHWDHIQGFPFFGPCYVPGAEVEVMGPAQLKENESMRSVFEMQMKYEYFPISNQQLAAKIDFKSIREAGLASIGGIQLQTQCMNHPVLCLGYRLTENGRTLVYTGDHEPYQNVFEGSQKKGGASSEDDALFGGIETTVTDANQRFVQFIRKAQVLLVDCTYTPEEYRTSRRNWGHSSWDYGLQWMREGEVERMVLTHHDPMRSDDALDQMLAEVRAAAQGQGLDPEKIILAAEGMEMEI